MNALDNALRKALVQSFPHLKDISLTDYKVRILKKMEVSSAAQTGAPATGTASRTRVLIESTDGKREWGTVGVHDNIIEASLQALVDSMEFALLKK